MDLLEIAEADSSQNLARARLENTVLDSNSAQLCERVWVRLARQSSGRGRQGRSWISFEGDLLVSCGLEIGTAFAGRRGFLSLIAGESLFGALRALGVLPHEAFLKWPNDLVASSSSGLVKYAGVLVEAFGERKFVVGWGVNIAPQARELPEDAGYAAGFFSGVDAATLFAALRSSFATELQAWGQAPGQYETTLIARLEKTSMRPLWGREGVLSQGNRAALARGLDPDGSLRVSLKEDAGTYLSVSSGEFRLR